MQDHPRVGRKCQSLWIWQKWDHPKKHALTDALFEKKTCVIFQIFYALILVIIHGPEVSFFVCALLRKRGAGVFLAPKIQCWSYFLRSSCVYVQGHALKIGLRHRWKVVGGKKTTAPYLTQKFCAIIAMEAIFYFHHVTLIFGPDLDVNKVL